MRRLSDEIRVQIRAQAHRAARARIAREVGEIIMGESVEAVTRDWTKHYVSHWVRAFAYFAALALSHDDHDAAREIVAAPEVQSEIKERVTSLMITLCPRSAREEHEDSFTEVVAS